MRALLLAALILSLALPARAAPEAVYDIRIAGFRVGLLRLAAQETGRAYSVGAVVTSAGAARVFRDFTYTAQAQGTFAGDRLIPQHYAEAADTGRRQSEAELAYTQGVPRVVRYTSPRAPAADAPAPGTQGGTLDPLSAMYALLRDRGEAALCSRTLVLFDGARRSHVVLGAARREDGQIVCDGEYRRLQGFTEDELSRHVAFPLTARFAPLGDGRWRAARVELQSVYGLATVTRR